MTIVTIKQAINWVYNQPRGLKRKNMTFLNDIMSTLDNPHKNLNIIHVAGTNGKGSTIAFMSQLLQEHGYTVARFTSPHLLFITERFQINNNNMSNTDFIHYVNQVKSLQITLSQFEIFVIIFILYANDAKVDYTLLEVGIGGLLDSTNFVHPIASVITSIGLDHTDMLGHTISDIAYQKGGIIKKNVPVFIGQLPLEAIEVMTSIAKRYNSTCYPVKYTSCDDENNTFIWEKYHFQSGLYGLHQQHNASLALSVIKYVLHDNFSIIKAYNAIIQTRWAGRLEKISHQPLIYLDGAHNEQGIIALLNTLKTKSFASKNIHILFSALSRKNYRHMVQLLKQFSLFVTTFNYSQAETAQTLASVDPKHIAIVDDWKLFLTKKWEKNDVIIVTGSLYFISEVKSFFENS